MTNPSPWLAMLLQRETIVHEGAEMSEILGGPEAIDIARITGLQLNRAPARKDDKPDVAPSTADALIALGADPFDFYIDLLALTKQEAADVIMSLLGIWQAVHAYAPEPT